MRPVLVVLALSLIVVSAQGQTATRRAGSGPAEDPQLRAEAVRLLERANHLSSPPLWPPNVLTLRYRVPNPAPGDASVGEYVSSVGTRGLRRQEWRYGAYQFTQIRNGMRLAYLRNGVGRPAILHLLDQIAPIYLVHFDNQDIIRSITGPADGTRSIQFDTVSGDQEQANEICVDGRNGWLLSIRTGDTLTTTSNFFPFLESFLPGHIERWVGGVEQMEVEETVVLKDDYPPDFFTVPENSTGFICPEMRMPYAVNTPQPPPGPTTSVIDVRLLGVIAATGAVDAKSLQAVDQLHPELNAEALKLVSTWTYIPSTCNGKTVAMGTTFTVHFKGR